MRHIDLVSLLVLWTPTDDKIHTEKQKTPYTQLLCRHLVLT